MSTGRSDATVDLIAIPRAVVSLAAEVVHSMERAVIGDHRIRTAQSNAWEAICADRARAHQRDEIRRLIAALTTADRAGTTADRAGTTADRATTAAGHAGYTAGHAGHPATELAAAGGLELSAGIATS